MKIETVTERQIGINFDWCLQAKAKETIGLNIVLPAGSDALAEQIRSNSLANYLGHLMCLAMGNPKGCIPLRVTVGEE